ncbi:hypothetical protein OPQ81_006427 [Rhizoctonia solani]|nr:hypothetical protein OPQ81_006427 [Rhizoctonia solani]
MAIFSPPVERVAVLFIGRCQAPSWPFRLGLMTTCGAAIVVGPSALMLGGHKSSGRFAANEGDYKLRAFDTVLHWLHTSTSTVTNPTCNHAPLPIRLGSG